MAQYLAVGRVGKNGTIGAICCQNAAKFTRAGQRADRVGSARQLPAFRSISHLGKGQAKTRETSSTGLGTDAAKSPICESVTQHRHAKPCSLNSFDLDIFNKVLYIGPYKAIGLYVWSLINEIECVRCSAPRRQAVADQIRQ